MGMDAIEAMEGDVVTQGSQLGSGQTSCGGERWIPSLQRKHTLQWACVVRRGP